MARVLAIGVDSMDWASVGPLVDAGALPNLAALRARAARATIDSRDALRSEALWTEFATGRTAASQGYWGMASFDPADYDARMQGMPAIVPWWARGDELPVVSLDLPERGVIAPEVSGAQVVAWGAHAPGFARTSLPPGLITALDDRFGPHPAFARESDPLWYSPDYLRNATAALVDGAAARADVLLDLMDRVPDWRLAVAIWSEEHSGGHFMWHGVDPHSPVYGAPTAGQAAEGMARIHRAIDAAVGRALDAAPDAAVVLFSLHGMTPNRTDLMTFVMLPELLHRLHGWAPALTMPRGGAGPVVPDPGVQWVDHLASHFADDRRRALRNRVKRATPRALRGAVRRAAGRPGHRPGVLAAPIPPETPFDLARSGPSPHAPDYMPVWWYRHRWPTMRYFAVPSFTTGLVRVNLRGRERDGVVDPADYVRTCEEIIERVSAARCARTGRPVVESASMPRAADPLARGGVPGDVEFVWSAPIDEIEHPDAGRIGPVPMHRVGEHSGEGFVLIAGPGVEAVDLGAFRAVDLAPTILDLLGAGPGDDLHGRSMLSGSR
ncbi:MAG: alkaline phosphatase family protein [Actinomycetes bacterium]